MKLKKFLADNIDNRETFSVNVERKKSSQADPSSVWSIVWHLATGYWKKFLESRHRSRSMCLLIRCDGRTVSPTRRICNCQTCSVMHCKLPCDFHFLFHAAAVHAKQIRADYDLRNSTDSLTWFGKRLNKVVAQYKSPYVRRLRGRPRVFLFIEIVVKWLRCGCIRYLG